LTDRRIVVFSQSVPKEKRVRLVEEAGGFVAADLWLIDALSVVTHKTQAAFLEKSLSSHAEILRIEDDPLRNFILKEPPPAASPPAVPSLPWNIKRIGAPQAWPLTRGAGVRVAVLDSGIDQKHPALQAAGGFNAMGGLSYQDDIGHGTHVAGIIAAQDVGRGVIGAAPAADIYAVKIMGAQGGTFSSIISGIQWCLRNKIDVANMSFGVKHGSPSLAQAVRNAAAAGLTMAAAAGNTPEPVVFPAAYPEVIAVSASTMRDQVAEWSGRGPELDFIAPGTDIRSTKLGGDYAFKEGTSMAAPHVTSLVALYFSLKPERGVHAALKALRRAAAALPSASPEEQGAGMVDAARLMDSAAQAQSHGL
jgi:subtilisin family serine protease